MIFMGETPRKPANECDGCHDPIPADRGAFCGGDHCPAVEDAWDRWLERHMDIGADE